MPADVLRSVTDFVGLADEHRPALGVGMKSDRRYAAAVFGIQFSYGPNQANRGLTPVDHRNSSWKRHCQGASVGHAVSLGLSAAAHYPFGTDC